ncbi:guanylate-binding protein 1-like [Mus pahari]|uniref:guanylate-binding protein 1-like n=1 Tax=Mus pahari TaxID=10093 RepID=UPI001114FB53|nr:guanylate-binding protein 1-like [Mus pahari]
MESARTESAEETIKMLKELNESNLKTIGQKQQNFEDYLIQLTEHRAKETGRLMAQQEMIFRTKLQEQEKKLNEKINEQDIQHKEEIRKLNMKIKPDCLLM